MTVGRATYSMTVNQRIDGREMRYTYLGDRFTRDALRGAQCDPVLRSDGKVIRGRNRNQLVRLADGTLHSVAGRRLRLNDKLRQRKGR